MLLPESEKFLDEVLSHIRFSFDRMAIRSELENHIVDKTQYLIEKGLEKDAAEKRAVDEMGSSKEIGIALNKIHSPIVGWIWKLTNVISILCILLALFFVVIPCTVSFLARNPVSYISKSDIVYHIKVDKTVKIDDTIIKFTDVIYEKDGKLNIVYSYYDKWLRSGGWSLGNIGKIEDNLGNTYLSGGGQSSCGLMSKCIQTVSNFNKSADTLIISYDNYNRHYRVEIPLKAGADHEQN